MKIRNSLAPRASGLASAVLFAFRAATYCGAPSFAADDETSPSTSSPAASALDTPGSPSETPPTPPLEEPGKPSPAFAPQPEAETQLPRLATSSFTRNQVEMVYDTAVNEALEQLVATAKTSVGMDFYIFGGPTPDRVADILIAKAKEGVQVRVLLDPGLGIAPLHRTHAEATLAKLRNGGIPVSFYSTAPTHPGGATGLDHNKYAVVDGARALVGSSNFAPAFRKFHDIMMKVEGPLAQDLARQFDFDYYNATHPGQEIRDQQIHVGSIPPTPIPGPDEASYARLIGTGIGRETAYEALLPFLSRVRKSIHVQMHELGDSPEIMDFLISSYRRGRDVKVLLDPNDVSRDYKFGDIIPKYVMNACAVQALVKAGVPVRYYRVSDEFTTAHMKLAIADGEKLFAGSMNWTEGGFHWVAETNVEVLGGKAPGQAEEVFARDWANGIEAGLPPLISLLACYGYHATQFK